MNLGILFLKSNLTGIITFSELDCVINQQSNFRRFEKLIANKLVTIIDASFINIGCRLEA